MTNRFFAYLLGTFAVMLLVAHRHEARWYAVQLIRAAILLGLAIAGLVWESQGWLLLLAGALAVLWFLLPRACWETAVRLRLQERWRPAANWQRLAGWLSGGRRGWLFRQYARVSDWLAFGDPLQAASVLDELAEHRLPPSVTHEVQLWKLALLAQRRHWPEALALYESQPYWSNLRLTVRARLHAARAYAETGQMLRGLDCLQLIAESPGLALFEKEYWALRVRLAAMAGDPAELEALLAKPGHGRRGFPRFAAYWRGRAALARGDRAAALPQLTRAYALTHPRDEFWRQAIRFYVERAERDQPVPPAAASDPHYVAALAHIRADETKFAPWGALLNTVRPAPGTSVLITALALAWVGDEALWRFQHIDFSDWASNSSAAVRTGQWWRLFTTMFVHADWLHLSANALGLWFFGNAVEKLRGRARMLALFFAGGLVGNLLSTLFDPHRVSIGASAGVFGLVGGYAVIAWQLPAAPLKTRLLQFLALVIATDLLIGALDPAIDDWAHLGGLLTGLALAALLGTPQQKYGNPAAPPV